MESMTPISCPTTPRWNQDRPFLTGRFHQETRASSKFADSKRFTLDSSSSGVEQAIGCYDTPVQELIVIDDLLSALVGIEGRYISIKRFHGKEDSIAFQVDPSMDLALQELAKRIFPLCEYYLLIDQFVESSSQFKNGLVNHAFAAALRALLLVCDIGLSSHGGTIGTSISTWKTFYPRIMVLLSAHDGIHARIGCSNSAGFNEAVCGFWCS